MESALAAQCNRGLCFCYALLTVCVVEGHRQLHDGLLFSVYNVIPLYCFHIAELLVSELDTSFENFCKVKLI